MSKRTVFLLLVMGLLALILSGCDTFLAPQDALSPMTAPTDGVTTS
jgi:hypothetical protein